MLSLQSEERVLGLLPPSGIKRTEIAAQRIDEGVSISSALRHKGGHVVVPMHKMTREH